MCIFLAMSSYPPEWDDMMGKAMIRVPLDRHSLEYIKVLDLFKASRPPYLQVIQVSWFDKRFCFDLEVTRSIGKD